MRCNGISEANVEPAGRSPIGLDDLRPVDLQPGLPLAASVGLVGWRRAGTEQGPAAAVQERLGRRVQEGLRHPET